MHPDAEADTRSPWYETFALHMGQQGGGVGLIDAAAETAAESAAQPETRGVASEAEWSTQELFDCYNG